MFCVDVDGVMTDGRFLYSNEGKQFKTFGPEDGDALRLLGEHLRIQFLTADFRGFDISHARICRDLGFSLELVPSKGRASWMASQMDLSNIAYMGDSFLDIPIFKLVAFSIAPANALKVVRASADLVTEAQGASGAVAEACFALANRMNLSIHEFP